jgi:hypothetical protein
MSHLREWQSGARPLVALASIPQASGLIWDPSLFLYGFIESSVGLDHVAGTEESTTRPDRWRTPSITIREHT